MEAALAEARKGIGRTHPNPAVGAVVVRSGRIIARGWHRAAGRPHAEVEALAAVRNPGPQDTLYVTLEPCSTHGRTPPCTEGIIRAGIGRVVYGSPDPNPLHAGRADAILRQAGIRVSSGILAAECAEINRAWNKWIATGMPWVIAKSGMSLDGRTASPPGRRWITCAASRRDAMALRASCDAILVGAETVRTDNPKLTVRGIPGAAQPLRAVWSRNGEIPAESHLLTDRHRDKTRVFSGLSLRKALRELARSGAQSVLIEGGGRTLGEAFDKRLVDEVVFYIAPILTGGPVPAVGGRGVGAVAQAGRLTNLSCRLIDGDLRISGLVSRAGDPRASMGTQAIRTGPIGAT